MSFHFSLSEKAVGSSPIRKYLFGLAGLVAQHGQFVDAQIGGQFVNGRFHFGQVDSVSSDFDLRVGPALVQQHAVHDSPVVSCPIHSVHAQTCIRYARFNEVFQKQSLCDVVL